MKKCSVCGGAINYPLVYTPKNKGDVCNECWRGHLNYMRVLSKHFHGYKSEYENLLRRTLA